MLLQLFYTYIVQKKVTTSIMPLLGKPQLVLGGILWSSIQLSKLHYIRDNNDLLAEITRQPNRREASEKEGLFPALLHSLQLQA